MAIKNGHSLIHDMQMKNFKKNSIAISLVLLILTVSVEGCASAKKNFFSVQSEDSIESYENYLRTNPPPEYADSARIRLKQLYARDSWKNIENSENTLDFENFLNEHPEGEPDLLNKAQDLLNQLRAWELTLSAHSRSAYKTFIEEYGESKQVDEAIDSLNKLRLKESRQLNKNEVKVFTDELGRLLYPMTIDEVIGNNIDKKEVENSKNTMFNMQGSNSGGQTSFNMTFGDRQIESLSREFEGKTFTIRRVFGLSNSQPLRIDVYSKKGKVGVGDVYKGAIGKPIISMMWPDEGNMLEPVCFKKVIIYQDKALDFYLVGNDRSWRFLREPEE